MIQSTSAHEQAFEVVSIVAQHFDVTPVEVFSRSRTKRFSEARHASFWILRQHTKLSFEEIAEQFDRDHSTVVHGVRSMERKRKKSEWLNQMIEYLDMIFRNRKPEVTP